MLGVSVGFPAASALGPPAPLGRHAAQHAGLRRPDGRAADGLPGLGGVPQVGQDLDAAALELGRLGVLVLVDEVLVDAEVHQLVDLAAPPRSGRRWPGSGGRCRRAAARRRSPGSASSGSISSPGHCVDGRRGHQVPVGEDRVEHLVPRGLPLVQRHGAPPVGSVQRFDHRTGARDRRATARSDAATVRASRTACAKRDVDQLASSCSSSAVMPVPARLVRGGPASGAGRSLGDRPASTGAGAEPWCGSGKPGSR